QAEDGIRDFHVTGVQTCALPICKAARARSLEVLRMVGIPSPEDRLMVYPHHLSGGMRQRIAIAIALLNGPKMIIADEPTTALDRSEERRVGNECRYRLSRDLNKK